MAAVNRMSDLIDKIERRLGTKPLKLPDEIAKDTWAEIIAHDTIDTFSRYYPRRVQVLLDNSCKKGDWYYLDKILPDNVELLGIADIDWERFSLDSLGSSQMNGYGVYDLITTTDILGAEDIMSVQMMANHASMYNNGIYPEVELPNKVCFKNATGAIYSNMNGFPIEVLVKHAPNLMTISPTKMETFEKLAICDVASALYEYLKYYEGVDTVYANIDLKLDSLASKAGERDEVIQELKESYVGFSNDGQSCIYCQ